MVLKIMKMTIQLVWYMFKINQSTYITEYVQSQGKKG